MTDCKTCTQFDKCVRTYHPNCNGYNPKELEQTNEQWFCNLSTEEKAKFFDKICYSAWGDTKSRFRDIADYTDWIDWLKEKHE